MARMRHHELAGLIALAYHNPAKLPAFKATGGTGKPGRSPVEQEAAILRIRAHLMAHDRAHKKRGAG